MGSRKPRWKRSGYTGAENVYKAKINEDKSAHVTIQLTATTPESLEKQMDGKEKSRSGIIREHLKQELHPGII